MLPELCSSCSIFGDLLFSDWNFDDNQQNTLTHSSVRKCFGCDQVLHMILDVQDEEKDSEPATLPLSTEAEPSSSNANVVAVADINHFENAPYQLQGDNIIQESVCLVFEVDEETANIKRPALNDPDQNGLNFKKQKPEDSGLQIEDFQVPGYSFSVEITADEVAEVESQETDEKNQKTAGQIILTEDKLSRETRAAMAEERSRMMRLHEQEKFYQKILPEIVQDSSGSRLILDIDRDTHHVRVEVDEELAKELKPHQREGIKFMYNSIVENILKIHESGSGCILGHDQGSGKSLQIIALIHTLRTNQYTKDHFRRVLIVTPPLNLKIWADEFNKWIESKQLEQFSVDVILPGRSTSDLCSLAIRWNDIGGVFVLGFKRFSEIFMKTSNSALKRLNRLLSFPGPDLLVVDEAQLITSLQSLIYQAVTQIKTKRKILVTGTPLQNKMDDFYTLVDIIKPRLLGGLWEFDALYSLDESNAVRNEEDVSLLIRKSDALNSLLSGTIQRFNQLELYLPPKHQFFIYIRPSERISTMYNFYLDNVSSRNMLKDFKTLNLCVNHPYLLQIRYEERKGIIPMNENWYKNFVLPDDWMNNELSGKFVVLLDIVGWCVGAGEKLVVVIQSLETFKLIARVLEHKFRWKLHEDYFRTDRCYRNKKKYGPGFNEHESAKLLLLWTGDLHSELTSANRVILFDYSWNPIDDQQMISRVYRLGQTKPVHVYRFVTANTMEEALLLKHTEKLRLIDLALDRKQNADKSIASSYDDFYKYRPNEVVRACRFDIDNDSLLATLDRYFVLNCVEVDSFLKRKSKKI